MESILEALKYLLISAGATGCGILYWMAMENMKYKKYTSFHVFVLSLLLTPLGAWIVSTFLRAGELSAASNREK
ncbi:MAG: hypothetical protein WCT99_06780 [Bacteroidota bacterium]|jgi:hypothetical protein